MEADIQAHLLIIVLKVRALMNGPMVESIQVIGSRIRCMGMVVFHGRMAGTTRANTWLIIKKDMEFLNLQTIQDMKVIGKTVNNMEKERKSKIIRPRKEYGKMGRLKAGMSNLIIFNKFLYWI